jgi:hypothetical protein
MKKSFVDLRDWARGWGQPLGVYAPSAIELTIREPITCPNCGESFVPAHHGKVLGLIEGWRGALWLFYVLTAAAAIWASIWLLTGAGWRIADYYLTQPH